MRIVTWNCQMGFDKKVEALLSQNPDVAVVPECSENRLSLSNSTDMKRCGSVQIPSRGWGCFVERDGRFEHSHSHSKSGLRRSRSDAPTPFTLIAVWACRTGIKKADNYIGQVYQALMSHPEWFDGTPAVLAGDLNSNKIWDPERVVGNHSDVVKILSERGLVSGYHEFFGEAQGAESRPTIYFYRRADRPFHIDYIFIPREWATRLKTVDVGEYERWSKLSDHCPVTVDI